MARRYSRFASKLLPFFALHRVALAEDVQRRFSDEFQSDRAARMHLQTLVEEGNLHVFQRPATGPKNVYEITPQGFTQAGHGSTPERTKKCRLIGNHLIHELLVTEVSARFCHRLAQRPEWDVVWQARHGLIKLPAFTTVVPDFAFIVRHRDKGILMVLLEVESGNESMVRVRQKLAKYANWMNSSTTRQFLFDLYRAHGAERPQLTFRLLFLVEDRRQRSDHVRLNQVLREFRAAPNELQNRLWCTSFEAIRAEDQPIEGRIWRRPENAARHVSQTQLWQGVVELFPVLA